MTPRAEELWSYLIGLGEVGKPVYVSPEWLAEDMALRGRTHRTMLFSSLVAAGCIKRISSDVVIVLKRIPASATKPLTAPDHPVRPRTGPRLTTVQSKSDCRAKLEEFWRVIDQIPVDTRDLTGRLMGDPIFERSSLYAAGKKRNLTWRDIVGRKEGMGSVV